MTKKITNVAPLHVAAHSQFLSGGISLIAKTIAAALIAAAAAPAHAYGVVYVAPSAPAYYAPQPPVYVQPVPVYVQPAPVYYAPQPAPVYQPAPAYVDPAVAVAGAAVAVTGIAVALAIGGHHYAPVHHHWH